MLELSTESAKEPKIRDGIPYYDRKLRVIARNLLDPESGLSLTFYDAVLELVQQ